MLKKKCDCCSTVFYVNKKTMVIECALCKQKFKMNGYNNWIKIENKKTLNIIPKKDNIKEFIQNKIETIGEYRKRLNIEIIKKKKHKSILTHNELKILNDYEDQQSLKRQQLRKLWDEEIKFLKNNNYISFERNEHKGKLRGKHIAKMFSTDLKFLNIKHKLYFRKDKAYIDLKEIK
jgi:hypothetical protein